jgi:hypothetical protein
MRPVTPASRLAELVRNYTPEIARAFTSARRKMRVLVPRGYALVYENYNALGIGYGPGEKGSDVIVSIVAYPRWITLFFLQGATLKDPNSLLEGVGSRVRSIRLKSPDDIDRADINQLISRALAPHVARFRDGPRLQLVVKSIAAKRRSRRPPEGQLSKASTKRSRKPR